MNIPAADHKKKIECCDLLTAKLHSYASRFEAGLVTRAQVRAANAVLDQAIHAMDRALADDPSPGRDRGD